MRWSYVITLSQPVRGLGQPVTATYAGNTAFAPGTTRTQAYTEIFDKYAAAVMAEAGRDADVPTVLFFSLEPDALEA